MIGFLSRDLGHAEGSRLPLHEIHIFITPVILASTADTMALTPILWTVKQIAGMS